ncbi:MAG: type II toxin-antitoxin system VapC family toxin [Waterburya sp.]
MIVLDTHIWIWWVNNCNQLTDIHKQWLESYQDKGLGISIISCWEVAKLVEKNRLVLSMTVEEWLTIALAYPGIQLLDLSLPIIIQSTQLTNFHKDPADQIIVATAKIYNCPLLTADQKILDYSDANTL